MAEETPSVIQLRITHTDSRDGLVILSMKDAADNPYEVQLTSMDVASLMGSLRVQLDEALSHPQATNIRMAGMKRVQYVETPESLYFRVFLYPVERMTTLGDELKLFADRVEARNAAKATHQLSGTP